MTNRLLVDAVVALIESHPNVQQSGEKHPAHCNLYVTKGGKPIATEPRRSRVINIWVRADSVDRSSLNDCPHKFFDHTGFDRSKPNHNLFREPGFKNTDLIKYQPTDLVQAMKVLSEVAGENP